MLGALALCFALVPAPQIRVSDAPPGLVRIGGGRTQIGIETKELVRLLESDPNSQNYAGSLSAETPRHERVVESFYLMLTEVTNEQYRAFVEASGHRPPEHWGEDAIRTALERFYADQDARKAEAQKAGGAAPPAEAFDRRGYWREHWRTSRFAVPAGEERAPVVFVDFDDAQAYARWAGLRLPTEFEYQRAVRGDTARTYPWGNQWDDEKFAATSLLKKKGTLFPVGSFPAGASRQGLLDLAGNVWEWTSSPYAPFSGWERRVYEFGFGAQKRNVNALADWNEQQRVVVGGSFQTGHVMARGSVRRNADRDQSTDALGFRCAASVHRGVDRAQMILAAELTPNVRPRESHGQVEFDPAASVIVERWSSESPNAALPGYRVITAYHHALFTPVTQIPAADPQTLDKISLDEAPVTLGFFSTSEPLAEPELPAGTYVVSYRARGTPPYGRPEPASTRARESDASVKPPIDELLAIDRSRDHLFFSSLDGRPLRALPTKVEWLNQRASSAVLEPFGANDAQRPSHARMRFDLWIPCRTTQKGFTLSLSIASASDAWTAHDEVK